MHRNIKLFAAFSTLLLTMCTFYDQEGAVVAPNGLSCQNRTNYESFEGQPSAECYYLCPDGTGRQSEIEGEFSVSSPLYKASKEELDAQFCQESIEPTLTQAPITDSPTEEVTELALPSPTSELVVSEQPLLRGDVTMCDVAINLINFRMIEPVPDLVMEGLEVQIGDQPTTCSVSPTNTSILTCTIPPNMTFPARVLVRLEGAVVNDFAYDGSGCA
jgi:hypothetical protein